MATFIVDQTGDDAAAEAAGTTLREAIAAADASSSRDVIVFEPTVFGAPGVTIYLQQGELLIDSDLRIDGDLDGDDRPDVTISGDSAQDDVTRLDALGHTITDVVQNTNVSDNSRVMQIIDRAEVELNGLILTGGRISGAIDGAGLVVNARETLVFSNGAISGNVASTAGRDGGGVLNTGELTLINSDVSFNMADNGGGIRNRGELIAENTTITHNIAEDVGGGLFTSGGALFFGGNFNDGFSRLTNVTIADNIVTDRNGTGGGIQSYDRNLFDVTRTGSVELFNTTITGNSAPLSGGGISIRESTVLAYNSIILGNGAANEAEVNVIPGAVPTFFDGGGNILSGNPAAVFDRTETRAGGDGVSGTADDATGGVLADNGGTLLSVALRDSDANPALDIGRALGLGTDATGAPRAIDRAGVDNGGVVDAGAFELQQGSVAVPEAITNFVVTTNGGPDAFDGELSLEEAIALAEASIDATTITFDTSVFTGGAGNVIRLSETLRITTDITIDGDIDNDGVADITVTGDRAADDVTTTTRDGVEITDIFNSPEFTRSGETETRLKDNLQLVVVTSQGDLTLDGLVLTGGADIEVFNGVNFGQGGMAFNLGRLEIKNSVVAGNISNDDAGAIYNTGELILSDTTLSDNQAASGGAIYNDAGSLRAERVTFADNLAQTVSGTGSPRGGALYNDSPATLINTTFVGNRSAGSSGFGGAIHHDGPALSSQSSSLELVNVTITGNSARGDGGGISTRLGDIDITNSIILGNDAQNGANLDFELTDGGIRDQGGNITTGDVTAVFAQTGTTAGSDGVAGNADDGLAGVLADNGGAVLTVALANTNTNPALEIGTAYPLDADPTDTAGNARAVDRAGVDNGGVIDAGALEVQQGTPVQLGATGGLVVNTRDDGNLLDGLTSISEAVAEANADPDRSVITFDPTVFTGGAANIINLAATLEITSDVTIQGDIDGDGSADIVLSGDVLGDDLTTTDPDGTTITDAKDNTATGDNVRVMRITNEAEVTLDGLTITGGFGNANGSGVLAFPDVTLSVTNSSISGNRNLINGDGGGLFAGVDSTLTIADSIVAQNIGGTFGGGVISYGETTISGTLFSGNEARVAGGGLYVYDGTTRISDSTLTGNSAGRGGAIASVGNLITQAITVSDNTASLGAGIGIYTGDALIQNSTIANNRAVNSSGLGEGGGVFGRGGETTIVNSTITGNVAGSDGGGVAVDLGRVQLLNNIVLGNTAPTGAELQDDPDIALGGGNVIGGDAALVFAATTVNPGVDGVAGTADDGLAGLLADNGATGQTVALRDADDNPALDQGSFTVSTELLDAAGNDRFVDRASGGGSGIIDAGALELQSGTSATFDTPGLVVNTAGDSNQFDGLTSLREAIALANADPDESVISFDPTVFTGGAANVLRLSFGALELSSTISINGDLDGDDRPDIVISGDALGDDATVLGINGLSVTDRANNANDDDNADRVFSVLNGADATLNGLVVTGGSATRGGGLRFYYGSEVSFTNGAIVGNRSLEGGGLHSTSRNATLNNVEISGNYSAILGGGLHTSTVGRLTGVNLSVIDNLSGRAGAGINNNSDMTIVNTTVANNTALFTSRGGGITNAGDIEIINGTITGNASPYSGGGIAQFTSTGVLGLTNTIVLGNVDPKGNQQIEGSFTDRGGNIIGGAAADVFAATVTPAGADGLAGTADDIEAGVLGDNGGLLKTVALRDADANPALDIGTAFPQFLTDTDAADNDRAVDRAAVDNGGLIDAGALELQNGTPTPFADTPGLIVDTLSDLVDPFDGKTSLREVLLLANADSDPSEITFDASVFIPGQDNIIRLTQGTLVISNDTSISGDVNGDALPDVTISGDALGDDATALTHLGRTVTDASANANTADNARVLKIENAAEVRLDGLTVTGGRADRNGGGVDTAVDTTLQISNSAIAGNVAVIGNGGGLNNYGIMSALNVSFSGNSAGYSGGGLNTEGSSGSDNNGTFFGVNLTFKGNYAARNGGGISSSEDGLLVNSTIVGNSSDRIGGGAEADDRDLFSMINVTVSGNTAQTEGGGLYIQSGAGVTIQNTILLGNAAPTGAEIEARGLRPEEFFTDAGGNLITADPALIFANTATLPGADGVAGTSDDVTAAVLDDTGTLFQSVSLVSGAGAPTPTTVTLDEPAFGLDFNGDGDSSDSGVTVTFAEPGASAPQIIAAFAPPGDPTDPGDGGPTDPGDGGPTDPGDGGPTDPGDGGPTDPGDNGPTDPGDGGPTDPGDGGPTDPGDGGPTDPGDGGPTSPPADDSDRTFVFSTLMPLVGGNGIDTVDFSGLSEDELLGFLNGVIADLDLGSAGATGSPTQIGAILDNLPGSNSAPLTDGSLTDIENIIGSAFDDGLFGNNEANVLRGGAGADVIAGYLGSDVLTGGADADVFTGSGADFNGDRITDLSIEDSIRLLDEALRTADLRFDRETGTLGIDTDRDGTADVALTLGGSFAALALAAIRSGDDTVLSLVPLFDEAFALAEGRALEAGLVNGLFDDSVFGGSEMRDYRVTLDDIGEADFRNTLGVYEVDASGTISGVRLLMDDVRGAGGDSLGIEDVRADHALGFFIIQNGADFAAGLASDATLGFETATGAAGMLGAGAIALTVNGAATDQVTFHALDAALNPDGLEHAISGVDTDGTVTIGFEDLLGLGDADFQDVVFSVSGADGFGL